MKAGHHYDRLFYLYLLASGVQIPFTISSGMPQGASEEQNNCFTAGFKTACNGLGLGADRAFKERPAGTDAD